MTNLITEETANLVVDGVVLAINGKRVLIATSSLWAAKKIFDIAIETQSVMYSSTEIDKDALSILYEDGGVLIFGTKETQTMVDSTINIG